MTDNISNPAGGKPSFLGIQITSRCNLSCPNCIQGRHPSRKDLHPDALDEILNLELFDHVRHAAIVGGETLLSPYLPEVIHVLRRKDITVESMGTNGLLIDKHLDVLSAVKLPYINISIDASSDEEYRRRRGGREGSFKRIECNTNMLARACPPETTIALSVLATRENVHDLARYVESFLEWPIRRLTFISIVSWPGARHEDLFRLLLFDTPANRRNLELQMDRVFKLDPPFRVDLPDLISPPEDRWCPIPFMNLTMDWEGNVSPCGWKQPDATFGNIFKDKDAAWNSQEMRRWRLGITDGGTHWNEHCRLCPYRGEQGHSYLPGKRTWTKREKACA